MADRLAGQDPGKETRHTLKKGSGNSARKAAGTAVERTEGTVPVTKRESLFDEIDQMQERIVKRAYEIFASNGWSLGRELDDWLQAERELVWKPAIELEEKDGRFKLQVATPGFEPEELDIQVTPEDILVKTSTRHEHKQNQGTVRMCEFECGNLFRSIHLPRRIDPTKVKTELRNGMLTLTVPIDRRAAGGKVDVHD